MKIGLGPDHIVLDEDPAPPGWAHPFQFSAHVCCGQTAEWIKMPLGREIDPGDIVLDGEPVPPKGGHSSPHFRPMSIVAKRLDGSGYYLVRR